MTVVEVDRRGKVEIDGEHYDIPPPVAELLLHRMRRATDESVRADEAEANFAKAMDAIQFLQIEVLELKAQQKERT